MMSGITQRLISGSALRVLNFAASALIAFFMTPFIIHSLGDRMYGSWLLVASFLGYYGLLDFGLTSAVNRYLAGAIGEKDEEKCNLVFNTALFLFSSLGFIVLLLTCILAFFARYFLTTPEDILLFRKLILIMGLSSAINFPLRAFSGVLTSQLRYEIMSLLQLMTLVIRTTSIAFALLSGYKILAMAWITLLAWMPEALLMIYFAKRNMPFLSILRGKLWNIGTAKMLFSYSAFTFVAQLGDILRFNVDAMVITAFIGLAAVTHYSIASTLGMYFINLMMAVTGVFQPVFSRQHGANDLEAIRTTFFYTSRISLFVASFPGFCLIGFGKPFILRWMGPAFLDAYPCLVVLVLGLLFGLSQSPSVGLLYGISKHRFFAIFNTVEGILNLALSLLLVRSYGILGVALGTFIPMTIMKLLIQPIYVCHVSGIRYGDYMRMMGKPLAIILIALSLPLFLALKYAAPDYLWLAVSVAILFIYYCAIVWIFGLTRNEKDLLISAIRSRNRGNTEQNSITVTPVEKEA
jgi:O-antigen/teichoic acid export membrane protein